MSVWLPVCLSPACVCQAYVAAFAFQTVMAEDMFNHFLKHFPHLAEQGVDKR